MSVVVSDTSPLHHLVLCGAPSVLPALFQKVVIPPTVFRELQQPNTPPVVREWVRSLPPWLAVQTPKSIHLVLNVDAGELEAICLAQEIKPAAVLMDDRAGRKAAIQCGLTVIGTIGLLEQASARGLVNLPQVMDRLRQTNARQSRAGSRCPGTGQGTKAIASGRKQLTSGKNVPWRPSVGSRSGTVIFRQN